jgi:hypothetical protein
MIAQPLAGLRSALLAYNGIYSLIHRNMNITVRKSLALLSAVLLIASIVSCGGLKKNRYDRCSHFSKQFTSPRVQLKAHG